MKNSHNTYHKGLQESYQYQLHTTSFDCTAPPYETKHDITGDKTPRKAKEVVSQLTKNLARILSTTEEINGGGSTGRLAKEIRSACSL